MSLEDQGFNVLLAEDGKIGWRKLTTMRVDLLITDWDMPIMTGIELVNKIKLSEEYGDVPILMLTAHSEKKDVLEAIEAGADNYIVKPFTPATVYKKLETLLGGPVI